MFKLVGQISIITGGAKGIGEGIAKVFADAGATVVIWDILEEGQKVADALLTAGHRALFQKVDVTSSKDVETAVEEVIEKYGKIDILINNAGIIRDKSFMKMTSDEWHAVMNVNLNSLFVTTKAVLPHMKNAGYGRIVSASSVNGTAGAFGQTNYSATKAAVQGFTKSLCKEVGKYGITVNCVAPGFIESEMTASMPQEVIEAGIKQIPIRRIGTPKDMGVVYLFLASKEAEFVNGITLHANGGAFPV
jgi:3-oxoacyl-[acyl-carrier protein] reductase